MVYAQNSSTLGKNGLSDRDILLDVLLTEKQLSQMYEQAITESTNNEITDILEQLQHDEHENIHAAYDILQQRGWSWPHSNEAVNRSGIRRNNSRSINSSDTVAASAANQQLGSHLHTETINRTSSRRYGRNASRNSLIAENFSRT